MTSSIVSHFPFGKSPATARELAIWRHIYRYKAMPFKIDNIVGAAMIAFTVMSKPRILRTNTVAFYHVYSRIVDRQLLIGDAEKRFFHQWMRRLERFSGVEVVTYCLMSNHFHMLVRVPEKERMPMLNGGQLRDLLPLLYSGRQLQEAVAELERAELASTGTSGGSGWLHEILQRYHARRYDLSSFVKDLKQRFSQWYNGRHQRVGTLWEDKFHSVLVEGDENMLLTMAAYIDLNPIRASLVDDPKDYRWSGYGEAAAGRKDARLGLVKILDHTSFGHNRTVDWRSVGPRYRMLLYGHGEQRDADERAANASGRVGISRKAIDEVLASGGQLSVAQALRCKVRYFCDGAVLGTGDFVDGVFEQSVKKRDSLRKSGARKMKGADWGELRALRDLQKNVVQ